MKNKEETVDGERLYCVRMNYINEIQNCENSRSIFFSLIFIVYRYIDMLINNNVLIIVVELLHALLFNILVYKYTAEPDIIYILHILYYRFAIL